MFGQDFEVDVQARFEAGVDILLMLVEVLKPGLVNILNFKFSRDADVG